MPHHLADGGDVIFSQHHRSVSRPELVQVRPFAFIFLDARWARATIKTGLPPNSLEFFQHMVVGIAVFRREYQSMFPLKGLLIENLHYFQTLHVPRGDRDGSLF